MEFPDILGYNGSSMSFVFYLGAYVRRKYMRIASIKRENEFSRLHETDGPNVQQAGERSAARQSAGLECVFFAAGLKSRDHEEKKGSCAMSEQPVIRNIPKEQFQESMDLSAFAFQYVLTEEDRYHREALMRTEELWGAYVDGRLAAKLTIHGFETWMHGKKFALGGIAGVATWPEYRRGGLVTKLLAHALMTMKEQGQTLSFLYPVSIPFLPEVRLGNVRGAENIRYPGGAAPPLAGRHREDRTYRRAA